MNIIYILSQVAGTIAFIVSLSAYHKKEKRKIVRTMMITNLLDIIHYILLGAYSGCIAKVIALIRNDIIVEKEKNKKLDNNIILIVFFIIYVITGILTFKDIFSLLPIVIAIIYMFFVWNGNELKVKKIAFFCYFLWIIYNIYICSIAGIISNTVATISAFIAVFNEKMKISEKS